MKASQKLVLDIEGIIIKTRFDELPVNLFPLAKKLETEGDLFGPVSLLVDNCAGNGMCVTMRYADKRRGPVEKKKIFGYDADKFMAKQYK